MLSVLWLSLSLSGCACATGSFMTWDERGRSAIVKLDTPGYPLWRMNTNNDAPSQYKDAEICYQETKGARSAILLNITLGHDNKTVFVNKEAVFPFKDYNRPPRISAYQVPADISRDKIKDLKELGLLNRKWEGLTLPERYLDLDYDRLVRRDPEQQPTINSAPELNFRIMGVGAHSRNDVLEDSQQDIVQVRMIDTNYGMSDSPKASWIIANVKFLKPDDQYFWGINVVEQADEKKECTWKSWRCADFDGAPYYRYIWRDRFDKYGRVGSARWLAVKKLWVLIQVWDFAGLPIVMSFAVFMSARLVRRRGPRVMRWWRAIRERRRGFVQTRRLEEEERLIEEIVNEVEDGEEKMRAADRNKPLPPLPKRGENDEVGDLIDLRSRT